eukprot:Phypoly_transcript_06021.p1 GENE.Phypoly_transcript_06021~~Phypoly_transcript_06021.p1  ORF type:complete len:567 (+),score=92.28 Phypoly_transcript_06021:113-1702(+)
MELSGPLFSAIEQGNAEIVQILLNYGAPVEAENEDLNWRPLHHAADEGLTEIIDVLHKAGAKINQVATSRRFTPLLRAIEKGHVEACRKLIELGANVNCQDKFGLTPLHRADNVLIARALLEAGADPTVSTEKKNKKRPFSDKKSSNQNMCHLTKSVCTPLFTATSGEVVAELVKGGANVNFLDGDGKSALHTAAGWGCTEVVDALLNLGATVDIPCEPNGLTPLCYAVAFDNFDAAKLLVEHGANVSFPLKNGFGFPINIAVEQVIRTFECTKLLLEHGADVNSLGRSIPLVYAVQCAHTEMVELLLSFGAEPNMEDQLGMSAIHAACHFGDKQILEILLACPRSDINALGRNGYTPLHEACHAPHVELIEVLVGAKAEIERVDEYGRTPLFLAAAQGHHDAILCLLKHGANINTLDSTGYSPLHVAAFYGHLAAIEVLLQNGATGIGTIQESPTDLAILARNTNSVEKIFQLTKHRSPQTLKHLCYQKVVKLNKRKRPAKILSKINIFPFKNIEHGGKEKLWKPLIL